MEKAAGDPGLRKGEAGAGNKHSGIFSVELEFKVMELGTVTVMEKEKPGDRNSTQ